jgi:predicted nucleic acid-binding Zn ribbon protein
MKHLKCHYCHKRIPMPPDFTICGYCEEILEELEQLQNAVKLIKIEREKL